MALEIFPRRVAKVRNGWTFRVTNEGITLNLVARNLLGAGWECVGILFDNTDGSFKIQRVDGIKHPERAWPYDGKRIVAPRFARELKARGILHGALSWSDSGFEFQNKPMEAEIPPGGNWER